MDERVTLCFQALWATETPILRFNLFSMILVWIPTPHPTSNVDQLQAPNGPDRGRGSNSPGRGELQRCAQRAELAPLAHRRAAAGGHATPAGHVSHVGADWPKRGGQPLWLSYTKPQNERYRAEKRPTAIATVCVCVF